MVAEDIMTQAVHTVTEGASLRSCLMILDAHRIHALPVTRDGRVAGIVTDTDILHFISLMVPWSHDRGHGPGSPAWAHLLRRAMEETAGSVMTRDLVTVGRLDGVDVLARMFIKAHLKTIPVVEDGRIVGIVSRQDLLKALLALGGSVVRQTDREAGMVTHGASGKVPGVS